MKPAIICDLDGTLAHMTERSPYDYTKVGEDEVDLTIRSILLNFATTHQIIIVTGRPDSCKEDTLDWIQSEALFSPDLLLMREDGDWRKDDVVKKELYESYIEGEYEVEFVLDDRDRVVKMWRELGLKCLQVAEGDF